MVVADPPGQSPLNRQLLSQGGDPGGRSSGALSPFWEEVIQGDRSVLEIIMQGYSIELVWTPSISGDQIHSCPSKWAGDIIQ